MNKIVRRWWKLFLARFRLNQRAVCEMSKNRGLCDDFHDYPDTKEKQPWHFTTLTCEKCGKWFTI